MGTSEEEARFLKEEYSQHLLSQESSLKIKNIFSFPQKKWRKIVEEEILKLKIFPDILEKEDAVDGKENFLNIPVFLFGGSSLLPEIKQGLELKNEKSLFSFDVKEKFIYGKDIDIKDKTEFFKNNPQYATSLILGIFA